MSESCDFNMATSKSLPKDAQVILSIMKELGINDHEPRVINQLLEFTYRYVTGILDDARLYANHARKKALDVEDIKLAIQLKMDRMFTNPPPRDILLEIARVKNSSPLPVIKPHCGVRLPPDRYCLAQCNYKLKSMSAKKPIKPLSTFQSSSSLGKGVARPPQTPTMKKPPQGPTIKIAPKPIVKVASGNPSRSVIKLTPTNFDPDQPLFHNKFRRHGPRLDKLPPFENVFPNSFKSYAESFMSHSSLPNRLSLKQLLHQNTSPYFPFRQNNHEIHDF